jgi:hypothetical protein
MRLKTTKNLVRFLFGLPRLRLGMFTVLEPDDAFTRILQAFEAAGFDIAVADEARLRFCALRSSVWQLCPCFHVVWVQQRGQATYINFGVEPQRFFARACSHAGRHEKLRQCDRLIRWAIEGDYGTQGAAPLLQD